MQHSILLQNGGSEAVELSDAVFAKPMNQALVHQVVTACLAGSRQGSRAQKTRGEVQGGGRKPWPQKGRGRARVGSIRSPLWRGGGITFAAKPLDFSQKINKKMYRAALCIIFSNLLETKRLIIVDQFTVDSHKTRNLREKLNHLELQKAMIITHEIDRDLYLAARNLSDIIICMSNEYNPVDLLKYKKIVMTTSALKEVERQLS